MPTHELAIDQSGTIISLHPDLISSNQDATRAMILFQDGHLPEKSQYMPKLSVDPDTKHLLITFPGERTRMSRNDSTSHLISPSSSVFNR